MINRLKFVLFSCDDLSIQSSITDKKFYIAFNIHKKTYLKKENRYTQIYVAMGLAGLK